MGIGSVNTRSRSGFLGAVGRGFGLQVGCLLGDLVESMINTAARLERQMLQAEWAIRSGAGLTCSSGAAGGMHGSLYI